MVTWNIPAPAPIVGKKDPILPDGVAPAWGNAPTNVDAKIWNPPPDAQANPLDERTQKLHTALRWRDTSLWVVYNYLWTLSQETAWEALLRKFLTTDQFAPIRESIATSIIAKAKIETGWFLWFWKKPTVPEIADKGIGDIRLTGVWSYPNITNGVEFEVAGKTYVIWSSRDLAQWVIVLSKEQATKTTEALRLHA